MKKTVWTFLSAGILGCMSMSLSAAPMDDARRLLRAQDYQGAMKVLEKEADCDNARAMFYIGQIFHRGLGMEPQRLTGIGWWERGALLGNQDCMLALSEVFNKGLGVKIEPRQGYTWDRLAALDGNTVAMYNMAQYSLRGVVVEKDRRRAARWLLKAAQAGYPSALADLATLLSRGLGVKRDICGAYVLYKASTQPTKRYEAAYGVKRKLMVMDGHMTAEDRATIAQLDVIKVLDQIAKQLQ